MICAEICLLDLKTLNRGRLVVPLIFLRTRRWRRWRWALRDVMSLPTLRPCRLYELLFVDSGDFDDRRLGYFEGDAFRGFYSDRVTEAEG